MTYSEKKMRKFQATWFPSKTSSLRETGDRQQEGSGCAGCDASALGGKRLQEATAPLIYCFLGECRRFTHVPDAHESNAWCSDASVNYRPRTRNSTSQDLEVSICPFSRRGNGDTERGGDVFKVTASS